MSDKEIIVLIPHAGDGNTCIGCVLHRNHRPGAAPIDEGCNFRKLCGKGQFKARLMNIETFKLRELSD